MLNPVCFLYSLISGIVLSCVPFKHKKLRVHADDVLSVLDKGRGYH